MKDLTLYDAVEMNPVRREGENGLEMCEETDPDIAMWSVYLHLKEGGVECVADCAAKDDALLVACALERAFPLELAHAHGGKFG